MASKPRMCKKANIEYAMSIGVEIMKEIEKKSFQKGSYGFSLPFGEFEVFVIRTK